MVLKSNLAHASSTNITMIARIGTLLNPTEQCIGMKNITTLHAD